MNFSIIYILFFILVIFISITIHEIGHFIFARIFNVRVKEFSIGIGPKIISFKGKSTRYSLRLFPIAAYVMTDSEKLTKTSLEIIYDAKLDDRYNDETASLSWMEYVKNMLTSDDKSFYFSNYFFYSSYRKYLELSVSPDDSKYKIDEISKWKVILISLGGIIMNILVFVICVVIWQFALNQHADFIESIKSFFINIFKVIIWSNDRYGSAIIVDTYSVLFVSLLMNINLSLFLLNVLPIPPLDGFKVVSSIYESVSGKKLSDKFENVVNIIGVVLVAYIMFSSIIQSMIF